MLGFLALSYKTPVFSGQARTHRSSHAV